ncbi:uncharacterized protein HGUI_02640 [Hanseniaspora guilliermondii]|uniref:AMP-activated protein kinase glycogen-binding domain-containing protein n=1 Tax=Hanseniaspora guilliermondii TaxID=56406 RepID=A0A1L0B1W3_9ASCO|nr:uncharacterized protein HGUI_02640 [Hanseniaspora guilliermondii]
MCSFLIKITDPRNLSIAGNFNNWTPQIMKYEQTSMANYINIKPNINEKQIIFKFVCGNDWFTSTSYNTIKDSCNNINNCIDIDNQVSNNNEVVESSIFDASIGNEKSIVDSNEDSDTSNDTNIDTTSHGTNDENIYYRVWVWIIEFFKQLLN